MTSEREKETCISRLAIKFLVTTRMWLVRDLRKVLSVFVDNDRIKREAEITFIWTQTVRTFINENFIGTFCVITTNDECLKSLTSIIFIIIIYRWSISNSLLIFHCQVSLSKLRLIAALSIKSHSEPSIRYFGRYKLLIKH